MKIVKLQKKMSGDVGRGFQGIQITSLFFRFGKHLEQLVNYNSIALQFGFINSKPLKKGLGSRWRIYIISPFFRVTRTWVSFLGGEPRII